MNGPPLESALECLKLLTRRRFFSQSKDQLALILAGTEATDNELVDDDGNFANITLVRELAPLDWDIIETLNNGFEATSHTGDLIDAIVVGVEHLQRNATKRDVEKHIILLSNLEGATDTRQLSECIERLRRSNTNLDVLGVNMPTKKGAKQEDEDTPGPSNRKAFSEKMRARLAVFSEILEAVNGRSFTFEESIPALSLFEHRATAQRPWRVDLEIGETLRIPLSGFILVRESRLPTLRNVLARDPSVGVSQIATYHLNDEAQTQVDKDETVQAFRYGATLVPFSEEDMDKVKEPAQKCLCLLGFTKAENVPRSVYVGNGAMLFVADATENIRDDEADEQAQSTEPAARAVSALVQALSELDSVALVRRVYSRASAPVLGVLIPRIDASGVRSLVYQELAFREDIRTFTFPSLSTVVDIEGGATTDPVSNGENSFSSDNERYRPNEEQLSAMDDFVSSMMLSRESETEEEENKDCDNTKLSRQSPIARASREGLNANITPEQVPNPWFQRFYAMVKERGLGNDVLPGQTASTMGTSSDWPVISPTALPGLETVLSAVQQELVAPQTALSRALREVNRVMPPVVAITDCTVLPEKMRKRHAGDGDDSEAVKRKQQAMASDLFGIKLEETDPVGNQPSTSQITSVAQVRHIGTMDPIGDFNDMLRHNMQDIATRQLEEHIYRLVDDPLTAGLLRPKALLCLRGYREAALATAAADGSGGRLVDAYNAFLRGWRRDLESSSTSSTANRLAFWNEVMTQDEALRPICNSSMMQEEATILMSSPIQSAAVPKDDEDKATTAQTIPSIDDMIGDLE